MVFSAEGLCHDDVHVVVGGLVAHETVHLVPLHVVLAHFAALELAVRLVLGLGLWFLGSQRCFH